MLQQVERNQIFCIETQVIIHNLPDRERRGNGGVRAGRDARGWHLPRARRSWKWRRMAASSCTIARDVLSMCWGALYGGAPPATKRASRMRSAPSRISAMSRPAPPRRSIACATCFGGASPPAGSFGWATADADGATASAAAGP